MPKVETTDYTAEINWHPDGKAVLYVVCRGSTRSIKDMVTVIAEAVNTVNNGTFPHVCSVYDLLDMNVRINLPQLGRLVRDKGIPSTTRTAHIVVGTLHPVVRMIGTIVAVTGSKRVRTVDVCSSRLEVESAVQRWLSLPTHIRNFTADNPLQD